MTLRLPVCKASDGGGGEVWQLPNPGDRRGRSKTETNKARTLQRNLYYLNQFIYSVSKIRTNVILVASSPDILAEVSWWLIPITLIYIGNNITVTIMGITHHPDFYLKHDGSDLDSLQAKRTQMGAVEGTSLCLRTKDRTMDSVQNCDSYINIPSSQTYR
jgi:hypothetical protein